MNSTHMRKRNRPEDSSLPVKADDLLKQDLTLAARILSQHDLNDLNQGQISCRLPGNTQYFLIKQALCGFNEATNASMITVPFSENQDKPKLSPPELPLHQMIYQLYPEVKCIIHTHSYYAVLFGALDLQLEPISHEGACFIGKIKKFTKTSQTILDSTTAKQVAVCLENANVLFLQNHGVVVVAKTIKQATVLSILLEKACKIQLHAKALGLPYAISNETDVSSKQDFIFNGVSINYFWDYLVRSLK